MGALSNLIKHILGSGSDLLQILAEHRNNILAHKSVGGEFSVDGLEVNIRFDKAHGPVWVDGNVSDTLDAPGTSVEKSDSFIEPEPAWTEYPMIYCQWYSRGTWNLSQEIGSTHRTVISVG